MNDILTYISQLTGLQPATLVLLGGIIITVSNVLSRVIPDDATGFLGAIRLIAKVVGANVSSRVTSGVTVNDVAKSLLNTNDSKPEVEAALKVTGALPSPGVAGVTRSANGKFAAKTQSPWLVTVVVFFLVAVMMGLLGGCATVSDANITKNICTNRIASRTLLNLKIAEDSKIKDDALRTAALSLDESLLATLNACPPVGPAPVGGL